MREFKSARIITCANLTSVKVGSEKLPIELQKIQVFVQKLGLKHPFSGQPTNRAASFLAFWNRHGPHLTRIAHWKAKSIGFQN